jgi:hypothetical protein
MPILASSFYSLESDSAEAGKLAAANLKRAFASAPLRAVLVYSTMNHDHPMLLEAIRAELPEDVIVLGTSVQGVVSNDELSEEGMVLGAMGFGGEALRATAAVERDVEVNSREKGLSLARKLLTDLGKQPKIVLTFYDPLSGVDVEAMLAGLREELHCPIVGAGSGQPWGPPIETAQFWNTEVMNHGVVALALSGPFVAEIGMCHGTVPSGIQSVVTKAEGNQIIEIDGQRAVDFWRSITGASAADIANQSHFAIWAVGVERTGSIDGVTKTEKVIRGAFGFNNDNGALILQASIPAGTKITLQHRTVEEVLSGTENMARHLKQRLAGRQPWAMLGFECAARTYPFLGPEKTREEHKGLRQTVAPHEQWLGMMAWGEIGPCLGQPSFHNYTYPLVALLPDAA